MSAIETVTGADVFTGTNSSTAGESGAGGDFSALLEQISSRQKSTTALLDTYESLQTKRQEVLGSVASRLDRYFLPEENLSQKLLFNTQWFSQKTGARDNFTSLLDSLSQDSPQLAAQTTNNIFSFLEQISAAFSNTSSSAASLFSSVMSFSFNTSALQSGLATSSFSSGFESLSMTYKMQQVEKYSVASVDESQMLGSGGEMMEVNGKFINMTLYMKLMDPVVLDLGGNGINLKSVEDGVVFDLAGKGQKARCGFVQGDDALLFLDQDGDGVCTNGKELFGDQEGHAHGFAELSEYDVNSDGEIDDKDSVYSDLKVWNDWDGDGECGENEVRSLSDAGVEALSLGFCDTNEENSGNLISQKSFFRRFCGELGVIADAKFAYR